MSANLSDWRDLAKGGLLSGIYNKTNVIPTKVGIHFRVKRPYPFNVVT
jgi:hypothetical protein